MNVRFHSALTKSEKPRLALKVGTSCEWSTRLTNRFGVEIDRSDAASESIFEDCSTEGGKEKTAEIPTSQAKLRKKAIFCFLIF